MLRPTNFFPSSSTTTSGSLFNNNNNNNNTTLFGSKSTSTIFPAVVTSKKTEEKGTTTRIELNHVPFNGISDENLTTKTISMLVSGSIASMSKNHFDPVENTIRLGNHLLANDNVNGKWQLNNISPLAAYNIGDDDLKDILVVLMGKSKLANDTAFLYIRLLQHLILETLSTVDEIYAFIMDMAQKMNNKRLYVTAKLASMFKDHDIDIAEKMFGAQRDMNDDIQNLIVAIHSFVTTENNPAKAVVGETSKKSLDNIHTIKLVGEMCGASYGNSWIPVEWTTNYNQHLDLLVALGQKLVKK